MTTLETLKAARKLIENENRWCFGEYARTIGERPIRPNSHKAYSFCAIGALCRVTKKSSIAVVAEPAYGALDSSIQDLSIHDFNDSHTHTEVLAAFDSAIANLEGK